MHACYQSVKPCHNRFLQQKWDKTYHDEHRTKVATAHPIVDDRPPATYMHLHLKMKKLQLEEEKLATQERDNRILLEKMSAIMRSKGRVDHRNNYEYKSLNKEKKKRELIRVTRENHALLRRITDKPPVYCAASLQAEWNRNQQLLDNISKYPKCWWMKPKVGGVKTKKGDSSVEDSENASQAEEESQKEEEAKKEEPTTKDNQADEKEKKEDGEPSQE